MVLETLNQIAPLHPLHERYVRLVAEQSLNNALANERNGAGLHDLIILEQLGEKIPAPGKWTAKNVIQHQIDTERILTYRALCIARNDQTPLPGFDESAYGQHAAAEGTSFTDLLLELRLVRKSTFKLFSSFDEMMLKRIGTCSGIPISVMALGYVITGHLIHHLKALSNEYYPLSGSNKTMISEDRTHLPYFERLNRAWIEKDWELESDDVYLFQDPVQAIIEPGGAILFAEQSGKIIGTVALQPKGFRQLKLIKMAVDEAYRGQGTGELLMKAALFKARESGAKTITLGSNTTYNAPAVKLYRKFGFREIPLGENHYQRANIRMQLDLNE